MEDAITATGANTETKKFFKIGVNCDAHNWFVEDVNKYEWDGPKVQYDEAALIDFYDKLINDHPLIEFIEDSFNPTHV
jgi:enolase